MADLVVRDLTVEYTNGGYIVRPLDKFNLEADTGSLAVLLGPSGCGKSTLLSALAGILKPASGEITVRATRVTSLTGDDLTEYRRRTVGVVFQSFNLVPSLTALDNVAAPMLAAGRTRAEAGRRAAELLAQVGLGDRAAHKPDHLSGGQQQRVAIARALAMDPVLVVADEPTAHLDYVQVEGVLRLVRELATPGRLLVVATHDERLLPLADQVVEMVPRFTDELQAGPQHMVLDDGEVVFEEGSRGGLIYMIEEGSVAIARTNAARQQEVLVTLGEGDHFGEMGPLFGLPRSATARVTGGTAVLTAYTAQQFRDVIGEERLGNLLGRAGARVGAALDGVKRPRRTAPARRTRKTAGRKATAPPSPVNKAAAKAPGGKRPVKKSVAKKATATKSPVKKATPKKATPKKATARNATARNAAVRKSTGRRSRG